jgi:hypothetical protein
VDLLIVASIALAFVGGIMFAVTRLRLFRGFNAIRRQLIAQATASGDSGRAARLSRELSAWEERFPKYALGLIVAGIVLALLFALLLAYGMRTI